jgi:hypothetical protein
MANFLAELELAFTELATHLKPSAGSHAEVVVTDVKNLLGTILGDIKSELAYLHSRIDQIDSSVPKGDVGDSPFSPPEETHG